MTAELKAASADAHIGDGVYVSFDGYQIWLAANHHENKVVALEPAVLLGLVDYARRINKAAGVTWFGGLDK